MRLRLLLRALAPSGLMATMAMCCMPAWAVSADAVSVDAQSQPAPAPQDAAGDAAQRMTLDSSIPYDEKRIGSGRLLLTGGVSEVEGAAGGGLTPWAIIGGYGTRDQIGANAFYTRINVNNYHLDDAGVLVGLYDRVELSLSQQRFDTEDVGAALGLGRGFTFRQDTFGVKVRIAGDAVLEQDSWLPQIAVGIQYKSNDEGGVHGLLRTIGASDSHGTDFYISATKLFLGQSLLVGGTLRLTRANQIGILGFGGDRNDSYRPEFEGSLAYLLSRNVAVGAEYRMKPDNLGIAREDDWYDAFVAWAPNKHLSVTLAWVDLGNIVIENRQRGLYVSAQAGF